MSVVGIPVIFTGDHWIGGVNYYLSLVSVLSLIPQSDVKFIVITNKTGVFDQFLSENVSIHVDDRLGKNNIIQKILNKLSGCDLKLAKVVNSLNIDLLTHSLYSKKYNCKTIWWKPDFQEKYYPELFSKIELWARDQQVKRNARYASIIYSSQNASDDYQRFYGEACTSHILRFVPMLESGKLDDARNIDVLKKYNINRPFFYLPNQFWAHKNHELVLKSLISYNDDLNFEVVSTGAMKDYRGVGHIERIKSLMEQVPGNKFKHLGLIPREDMLSLMKNCLAVINPSKFEGWSTTVEEAKYMGKRLILSDLPVHREQNPMDSIYVDINSVDDVTEALREIIVSYDSNIEMARYNTALNTYEKARLEFAMDYFHIIKNKLNKQ